MLLEKSRQMLLKPSVWFKCFLYGMSVAILAGIVLATWILWDLPDVGLLREHNSTLAIEVPDWDGSSHEFLVGPQNPYWVPLKMMPTELKWAVIVAEDANFYEHDGIDMVAVKEALKHDLKHRRLERGASTITQQLAKNLFLSRDKSLRRKLREFVLAVRMEQILPKERILELYLNVVELGPLIYGAGHGAHYHFKKPVRTLTPAESAFLAAILPGPRLAFNPKLKPAKVRQRAARLLKLLEIRNVLSETETADSLVQLGQLADARSVTSFFSSKAGGD